MKFEMTPEQVAAHQKRVGKVNPLQAELERLKKRAAVTDKPTVTESKLQQIGVALVRDWLALYDYDPKALYAIPNGANVSDANRMRLVAEGMVAGVADLFLMIPNAEFHGLYIEVKRPKEKLREPQMQFEYRAHRYGYAHVVCYSSDEIVYVISRYLSA